MDYYYYSYTKNTKISFFLASMLMMFVLSTSDNAKDKQECTDSLVGLATCLPYVGGTARNPTPDCCSGLKTVLKTNKKCLCVVIHDRNDPDLGLNINVTLALGLPNVCDAPANVSQCPALLKLPPNSPDAQVFYQLEQKPSNSPNASSPVAQGPTTHGMSNPVSAPGSVAQQNSGGCGNIKAWLGWEIIGGLILLSSFIGM